jgi:hypothetical protein
VNIEEEGEKMQFSGSSSMLLGFCLERLHSNTSTEGLRSDVNIYVFYSPKEGSEIHTNMGVAKLFF